MTNLKDDSKGAVSILLVIFVVALSYGVYVVFFKQDDAQNLSTSASISEISENNEIAVENDGSQRIISLNPVNGYEARGKAVIDEDRFGMFSLQLSLALPSEFETTFYEAYLKGNKTVNLGRLNRVDGLYKLDYTSNEALATFDSVVIVVDGDATTVEGKTLPHDVMLGELN